MYTDEDLYSAVEEGIFDKQAVDEFRNFIARASDTKTVDEENFRLLSGFNDIFVSISATILVASAGWLFSQISLVFGFAVAAIISWFLSVFFVIRKKLALPAILFLISFVVCVAGVFSNLLEGAGIKEEQALLCAFAAGALAAWLHWWKFQVPITVAAGVASFVAFLLAILESFKVGEGVIYIAACLCGAVTLVYAMFWDAQDTLRKTRKSDVGFWLHLLAAPLFVHPIFMVLGVLDGDSSLINVLVVIFLYAFLAFVSIVVDRRALMVSSLIYVLFAFKELFNAYGIVDSGFAVSGVIIGTTLLLLSAFWHKSRAWLIRFSPKALVQYLPPVN